MTTALDAPTDARFLIDLQPGEAAPSKLAAAAAAGDVAAFVDRLRKWLPDGREFGTELSAWTRDPSAESPRTRELFDVVAGMGDTKTARRGKRKPKSRGRVTREESPLEVVDGRVEGDGWRSELGAWLATIPADEPLAADETILLAEALLARGRSLPAADLWRAWRGIVQQGRAGGEADPVRDWFVAVLAFDDRAREVAATEVERALLETTDNDGTPGGEVADRLARWLAPFVGTRLWADRLGLDAFDDEGRDRLRDTVSCVAAMLRADGSLPFAAEDRRSTGLLTAAVEVVELGKKSAPRALVAEIVAHGANGKAANAEPRLARRRSRVDDEVPAAQSDWGRFAHLRSDWTRHGDSLVVAHHARDVAIDLAVLGHPLLTGTWEIAVSVDGRRLELEDEGWDPVCWFSDEEVDYVEVQQVIGDVRIERQLLLPRGDRFAILADVVTAAVSEARIDYESRLPLAPGLVARADVDTRECTLHARRPAARVFPLALPQDRMLSAAGWFGPDEDVLRLEQSSLGGLYAPVFVDWAPDRLKAQADWRTLTVTEAGSVVSSARAAGARIRVGDEQLLLYRSHLPGTTARAVLGLHTTRETVIGRVPTTGEIETLLLVE